MCYNLTKPPALQGTVTTFPERKYPMQTLQVQEYSLINFLQAYDKAKAEGFVMSTESGYAPVEIGGFYFTVMIKPESSDSVVQEPVLETAQEETQPEPDGSDVDDEPSDEEDKETPAPAKRGRKPKA